MHSRVLLPYVNKLYKHGFSFSFIFTKDECNSLENLYPSSDSRFYLSKHRRYLKKTSRFRVLRVIYLISWLVKLKSLSKKLLIKYKPDFVILSSDRYLELGLMISRDCQYLQIPTFILGIDYFYVEKFDGYYNKSRKPLHSDKFYDRILLNLFKNQVFPVKDFHLMFYRPYITIILYVLNILPKKPFLSGFDFAKFVIVDSEKTKEVFLAHGAPDSKIKPFGLLDYDTISLNLKCSKKENRSLVILALPQLYEHQLLSKEQHFAEIEYLVSTISKYSTDVLVSLHPKMDKVHYLFLEKKYNVVIAEQNLIDIIHLAKIFISTYSSTVLWSVALGIPSIIVDFYTLNYSYFKNFKGVGIFSEKQSFEAYLVELLKFGKLYKSKEIDQIKDSKNTAVMDGNCISNLIKLINEY